LPRALITGVTGQDGIYLARLLLDRGYEVVGTAQPGAAARLRMAPYLTDITVINHDLRDSLSFAAILDKHLPDEVYNLAAFSSVGQSWQHAELVGETNGMAVLRMLEVLRLHRDRHGTAPRFYQASTSEMFGLADHQPQTENTPHHPRSPYAATKSFAHHLTINYRESYGLWACSGVLYNHESPLRGLDFVTRKITRSVAEMSLGRRDTITLGNLDVCRDWGAAPDYVEAMWRTLQQDDPIDYIIATGISHSLSDLLQVAFDEVGLHDYERYVRQDPALMRPADVVELRGDATKAREELGWEPTTSFEDIIRRMVRADIARLSTGVEESPDYLW
jgi:GDPmannose 4,6-dehydratase